MSKTVQGVEVKRVFPETLLSDESEYAVVGVPKDDDEGGSRIAFRGSYDDAADYAERNESDDNYESYYVAEVVSRGGSTVVGKSSSGETVVIAQTRRVDLTGGS